MKASLRNLQIQKFDFLVALYVFCVLISEIMGIKTFPLFHIGGFMLNASVAIFLLPIIYTINDSIIEVFGAARAKSVYRSALVMVVGLMLFSALAIVLPPSARFSNTESAYELIFGLSIRIAIASLTAFAISDLMDIAIFDRLTKAMGKRALWFRNNASNFISTFLDTVIFMTLAFYALDKPPGDNLIFLASLILPYWLLKCSMSLIETPLVYIGVKWLKNN